MTPNPMRTAQLRDALESCMDALYRRRASEIPEGYLDEYVGLDWLEWNGGSLRLTTVGENIRLQLRAEALARQETTASSSRH